MSTVSPGLPSLRSLPSITHRLRLPASFAGPLAVRAAALHVPTTFNKQLLRPPVSPASLLVVAEEVDGVLVQVLPPVVIAHDGLRVFVLTHHLHLPVCKAGLKRLGDSRPSEVVRREVAEPGVVGPLLDYLLRHPR